MERQVFDTLLQRLYEDLERVEAKQRRRTEAPTAQEPKTPMSHDYPSIVASS